MKSTKSLLLLIALLCIGLIGFAVYLQIVEEMAPCPWCIIQRYIFAAIAIVCAVCAFAPHAMRRVGLGLATLLSLGGVGAASWLLWVQAHPGASCGIDPMETSLNLIAPARWFPTLFQADGLCTTIYDDMMGLSVSQWSLVMFALLTIVLGVATYKRR